MPSVRLAPLVVADAHQWERDFTKANPALRKSSSPGSAVSLEQVRVSPRIGVGSSVIAPSTRNYLVFGRPYNDRPTWLGDRGVSTSRNATQAACTLVREAFRQSTESRPASIARIVQRRAAIQNSCRCPAQQNF